MGKHERYEAELVEKSVTYALNRNDSDKHVTQIADSINKHLEHNFGSVCYKAVWVGREEYSDAGDIHAYISNGRKIPIELKVSGKNGSGTKANPGVKLFQKYIKDIENYKNFDIKKGLLNKRHELLEKVTGKYPKNAKEYQKMLRSFRNTDQEHILEEIAEITAPGQVEYAKYASDVMNENIDSVQNMINNILSGNNTCKDVIVEDLVYCVVKNYSKSNQTIEFYDFSEMDSSVTKVVAEGKSIKFQNKYGKDILRFSVNWKNICQGGANPAFTVFVGNAMR